MMKYFPIVPDLILLKMSKQTTRYIVIDGMCLLYHVMVMGGSHDCLICD